MGTLDQLTGTPVTLPNFTDPASVSVTLSASLAATAASYTIENLMTKIRVKGRFVLGTTTAVAATGTFPNGLISKTVGATVEIIGQWWNNKGGATSIKKGVINCADASTTFNFGNDDYTTAGTAQSTTNATNLGASGDVVFFEFTVQTTVGFAAGGYVALGAGLASAVKAGLLNYYDTGSFVANFNSGMNTSTNNVTITYARLGPVVTLTFPSLLVTVGVTSAIWQSAAGTVPTLLRPSSTVTCSGTLAITNKVEPGTYGITSSGQLNLYRSGEANFTSGTTQCGIYFSTITYSVQ